MNNLCFFDYLQENVYVTDIETYQLVYMNKSAMSYVGVQSLEDVKGQKCHKVLYGNDTPCSFCTIGKLKVGEFYEWKYKDEALSREFLLRDTLFNSGGREYRLEIGLDINNLKKDFMYEIQNYKEHEKIINEGLAIALGEENADWGIECFLAHLGKKTSADRCYIFENNGNIVDNTYEWCAEGVSSEKDNLQGILKEKASLWYDSFKESKNILIRHLEDIKEDHWEMYEILKPQNIETLIVFPIVIRGEIIGFYGVDNVPLGILKDVDAFLSIVSQFLSVLLQNRNLIRHLERMGQHDALTKLFNRATAEGKINEILLKEDGSFILFDLDKFKSVNDVFGHQKGDVLLQNIASDVENLCRKTDIVFRIGGDEFGIFYPTMTDRETISEKCSQLVEVVSRVIVEGNKKVDVGCSIGVAVSETDGKNFQSLYLCADRAMYRAKKSRDEKYFFFSDVKREG